MAVKVLPTIYDGIKFRSRTEARWAILFTELGINWEYEREGYQLPSGRYLPDFYLHDVGATSSSSTWFEVKGKDPTEAEQTKARELSQLTGEDVIIAFGSFPKDCYLTSWDTIIFSAEWGADSCDFFYQLSACPKCHKLGFVFCEYAGRVCSEHSLTGDELIASVDATRINNALQAARSKVWENGN